MNKKFLLACLFCVILFFSFSYVSAEIESSQYNNLILNVSFSTSITSQDKTNLEVDVNIFPFGDERQQLVDYAIQGNGNLGTERESVRYEWNSVNSAIFGWNAIVKTSLYYPKIGHIAFPSKIEGLEEYKKATEYIDITEEITKTANELVAGKTDWFEAIHEVANYVYENLTYDRNFISTQEKASWVMQNKKGVCDEYTALFIALVRSLGIPARYVSGVAYTNIEKNFGNHAWAEVYDGKEWIPFDTTFGQFGWLDASHISLAKTSDAKVSDVKYSYTSSKIDTAPLVIKTIVVGNSNELQGLDSIKIDAQPIKSQVHSESFVPLKISIKNLQDYYLPLQVYLSKGLEIVGKNSIHILVSPSKTKTAFFILKVPRADNSLMYYTATLEVRTQFNDVAITSLDFSNDYELMNLENARLLVASLYEPEIDYRYDASLNCEPLDSYYYGEEIKINCTISSNSNVLLKDMSLCIKAQCYKFDLSINSNIEKDFLLKENDTSYIVKLSNADITRTQFVPVNLIDKPNLQILDINPKNISYQGSDISVIVKTNSICREALLTVNGIHFQLGDIDKVTPGNFYIKGGDALANKLEIIAECRDLRGNLYKDKQTFFVQITDLPWYAKIFQKIILFFNVKNT